MDHWSLKCLAAKESISSGSSERVVADVLSVSVTSGGGLMLWTQV